MFKWKFIIYERKKTFFWYDTLNWEKQNIPGWLDRVKSEAYKLHKIKRNKVFSLDVDRIQFIR